jgi:hypothetical protein
VSETDPNADLIGFEYDTDLPPHRCRVVGSWELSPLYVEIEYHDNPEMPTEIRPAGVVRRRMQLDRMRE